MPSPNGVVVLLDRERTLRFDATALVRLKMQTARSFGENCHDLKGSPETLVMFVWAGLLHAEPKLTWEDAAKRVDLSRIGEISGAVSRAIDLAFGIPDDAPRKGEEAGAGKAPPAT